MYGIHASAQIIGHNADSWKSRCMFCYHLMHTQVKVSKIVTGELHGWIHDNDTLTLHAINLN